MSLMAVKLRNQTTLTAVTSVFKVEGQSLTLNSPKVTTTFFRLLLLLRLVFPF